MKRIAIALIAVAALGCGGAPAAHDDGTSERSAEAQAASGAKSAASTGFPACDKYIQMVSECIATKMPESERAEERQRLEHFRSLLSNPMLGAAIAQKCEENIRLEMQRDRYGCYAARAQAAGVRTACSLVTPGELQEVFKAAFAPGIPGNSACVYESTSPPKRMVRIEVDWNNGRDQMEAWRTGVAMVDRETRKSTGQSMVEAETLAGVADDAFFVLAGFQPMLAVRKGDIALSIQAPATREQLVAIARKALARLP